MENCLKKATSIVLNNFKNDSRVLKENISLQNAGYDVKVVALHDEGQKEFESIQNIPVHRIKLKSRGWSKNKIVQLFKYFEYSQTLFAPHHVVLQLLHHNLHSVKRYSLLELYCRF